MAEPVTPEGRIVLWLPAVPPDGAGLWERVGTLPWAAVTNERGICSTVASSVPTRPVTASFWTRAFQRFRPSASTRTWTLPDGTTVEQCGKRRADLRLVWSQNDRAPLDEARLRSIWPECQEVRAIGENLFLVAGVGSVQPSLPGGTAGATTAFESPVPLAERALAVARGSADPLQEAIAMTDLGLACLRERNPERARKVLEDALVLERKFGDAVRQAEVLSGLGQCLISLGQPGSARQVLGPALSLTRSAGERYVEKAVLESLGHVQVAFAEHAEALASFEQALALARVLNDREHELDLLWLVTIQNAELGDRERAIASGEETVDLLRRLAKPQAEWYAQHLSRYRAGATVASLDRPLDAFLSMSLDTSAAGLQTSPPPAAPSLLRMARTATEAMIKFVGSGFKTTDEATYNERVQVCAQCEHHTGLRCRLCGCFTAVKARLLHEDCPAGRWRG